jgi:hypothetical protein
MPAGTYKVEKALNLTDLPAGGLVLEGAGRSSIIEGNTGQYPVLDMTGSGRTILRNFVIQTPLKDGKWQAGGSTGILMARDASNGSSGHHSLKYALPCTPTYG